MTRGTTASTLACLLGALCVASCNRPPTADRDPARQQVMKDAQGRSVQLDPVTGQVTPVEPSATGPAASQAGTRGGAPASAPAAATVVPSQAAPTPPAGVDAPPPQAPDVITVQPAVVSAACVPRGSVPPRDVITVTAADAFVRPGRLQAPVATLPANTRARAVSAEGEWLLLRFDIGSGGDQRAYVHCSEVVPLVGADR